MGSVEPKVATYVEFAETVLPRIKRRAPGFLGLSRPSFKGRSGVLWWVPFKATIRGVSMRATTIRVTVVALGLGFIGLRDNSHFQAGRCERAYPSGVVLPGMGYNAVQLMAIAEHAHYGRLLCQRHSHSRSVTHTHKNQRQEP